MPISTELAEATWSTRPNTPEHRVKMSVRGPDPGVDPDWWRREFGASYRDVEQLRMADIRAALDLAGQSVPSDEAKARQALHKFIGTKSPESSPTKRVRWSEMSKEDQEAAIDDAQIAYAEGHGKRISRKRAAELLAKEWA